MTNVMKSGGYVVLDIEITLQKLLASFFSSKTKIYGTWWWMGKKMFEILYSMKIKINDRVNRPRSYFNINNDSC